MGFSECFHRRTVSAERTAGAPAAIMAEKEAAFRNLASGKIRPLAGLMPLLAAADRADVPMVAVTNAPRRNAEMLLAGLGIWIGSRPSSSATSSLTAAAPDAGSRRLARRKRRGRALPRLRGFRSGVQSAAAAGIATIGIRTSLGHDDLLAAGAVCTAATFDDPELLGLVGKTMNW